MLPNNRTKMTPSCWNAMFIAIALVAMIAAYRWMIAPHTNYLRAAQKYRITADNLVKKKLVVLNKINSKKRQLEQLKEQYGQISTALFDANEAKEFFERIQDKARNANCIISSLKILPVRAKFETQQPQSDYFITENSAILGISGDFKNIVLLVNSLQDNSKKVFIDSIDIKSSKANSEKLECDITVRIFVTAE